MPPDFSSSDEDNERGCWGYVSREFLGFVIRPEVKLPEVEVINNYAVFMGYLSMAVRGLGFLVVTWTTVVLLGGFVSDLSKKDFWSLTVITLSQTIGVFDVFLNEKLGSIWLAYRGLFITSIAATIKRAEASVDSGAKRTSASVERKLAKERRVLRSTSNAGGREGYYQYRRSTLLGCMILVTIMHTVLWIVFFLGKAAVQALLIALVLLPLAILYIFGLYISTSISLWRLIQHDYAGGDGGANMEPALNVLYSLTVVQGMVYCYKIIFARQEKSMVVLLAEQWSSYDGAVAVTWDYLRETVIGCEKDPSFARERNLVTYAVDLIETRSAGSYLLGTRALVMLLDSEGHGMLIRQLIARGASGHALHKLLATLGPGSPYCQETRRHAASIVAHLASLNDIHLAQIPGGIQLVSSMLHDDSCVDNGLRILGHLADDEGNRMVMRNTPGLVSSVIIAPLGSGLLHPDHCRGWDCIAGLVSRLTVGEGETAGLKVRSEISRNHSAIGALESILKCGECSPRDRVKANDILADLSMEMMTPTQEHINGLIGSFRAKKEQNLVGILVDNFIHAQDSREHHSTDSINFAGTKLAELSLQSKTSAQLILKAHHDVAANLITIVRKEQSGSTSAAKILNNLCSHYSKDDECFDTLRQTFTDAMPKVVYVTDKVLREILPCLTGQEIRAGGSEGHYSPALLAPAGDNSEIGFASQENTRIPEERERCYLKKALTFFCLFARMCDQLISADHQDLSCHFDEIAAVISRKRVRTLASLVQEAHEALEAIEAQEALDKEKKRAEKLEKPSYRPRGMLDYLFPRTAWGAHKAREMPAGEQETPHFSGSCADPLPEA